jgi:hypothetical protein
MIYDRKYSQKRQSVLYRLQGIRFCIWETKAEWIPAGNSKRAAERHLTELMGDVHNGTFRELKKATFSQFAGLWLESYAKLKTKHSTYRSYHDIIHAED